MDHTLSQSKISSENGKNSNSSRPLSVKFTVKVDQNSAKFSPSSFSCEDNGPPCRLAVVFKHGLGVMGRKITVAEIFSGAESFVTAKRTRYQLVPVYFPAFVALRYLRPISATLPFNSFVAVF